MTLSLPKAEQRCPQCYQRKPWPENFIGARGLPVGMCSVCRETYQSPGGWRSMTLAERAAIPRRSVPAYPDLRARLYPNSHNQKLGGIPASVTSRGTCPPSCSFYQAGCFATYGKQAHHWRVVGESGDSWGQFLEDVRALPAGQLWRHNVAGDLPGEGERVDPVKLLELVAAAVHTRAFSFSHKATSPENRDVIAKAVRAGFAINLSADSLEQADALADLAIAPVAVVLPSDAPDKGNVTPKGRKILVCPAERVAGITCARCGVCAKTERHALVGFRAHGQASAYVSELVTLGRRPHPRSNVIPLGIVSDDEIQDRARRGIQVRRSNKASLEERLERIRQGLSDEGQDEPEATWQDEDEERHYRRRIWTLYEREYRERATPGADQPEANVNDHLVDDLEIERWANEVAYELVVAGRSLQEAMALANRDTSELGEEDRPASLPPEPTKRATTAVPKPLELRVFGPEGEIPRPEADMEAARARKAEADIEVVRERSRRRREGVTPQTLTKTKRPKSWAPARKHAPAAVGDVVGAFRVIDLLPPDLSRNERVVVECESGHKRVTYSFNLRKRLTCFRCRAAKGTNGVHHMPPWVASPSSPKREEGQAIEANAGASRRDGGESPAAFDEDGPEAAEIMARVLAAVVKLGFPTAGMVAYEADLPAHEAVAALNALAIDGTVRSVRSGRDLRWRLL